MNLIICLDNGGGYSFAGKRQSQDKILIQKMLELVGENRLLLTEYSAKLFDVLPSNVFVVEEPLSQAGENDFCFIENLPLENVLANKVMLFHWNRSYPSDKKFPEAILFGKKLISSSFFTGNSHAKITVEVYG
ncbi:MAG: ribonuclease Z [Clostridia bacterium]|nr:ribonuclease Z [Clostridia bacterium]